jgi:hypothetical protein
MIELILRRVMTMIGIVLLSELVVVVHRTTMISFACDAQTCCCHSCCCCCERTRTDSVIDLSFRGEMTTIRIVLLSELVVVVRGTTMFSFACDVLE